MFSIVICTFNNVDMLKKLILRLLSNCYVGQIIIVDNASTDGTSTMVAGLPQKVSDSIVFMKNEKNLGITIPRNRGLREATSLYSMILDDDQLPSTHTFRKYAEALEEFDIVGYIPGNVSPTVGAVVAEEGAFFNHVGEGGICMKTILWKELNYFDETFSPAYREGPDLQLRAIRDKNVRIGLIHDAGIAHLEHVTLSRNDLGFNAQEVGEKNHEILMRRLITGYYGDAYKVAGHIYKRCIT